ncbi:MAG: HIRAN domain-containing protein [Thermoleophilia bacterium]|nr:HIRAN domain-containing protein [Thermoleophilia bacterium]
MGLFRRKKPKEQEEPITLTAVELPSGWRLTAAGTSFRQEELGEALRSASKDPPEGTENLTRFADEDDRAAGWIHAILVPEPSNEHDPNAIAIYSQGGRRIGYLPADKAAEYQPVFDTLVAAESAHAGRCPAYIWRAPGKGSLVLTLCVSTPDFILRNGLPD